MKEFGKLLVLFGLCLCALGGWIWFHDGLGFLSQLGRLPGDIHFEKNGFSVHIPLMTCLLLSLILTLIYGLFRG